MHNVSQLGPNIPIGRLKSFREDVETFCRDAGFTIDSEASHYGLPWVVRLSNDESEAEIAADLTDAGAIVSIKVFGDRDRAYGIYFKALGAVFQLGLHQDGQRVIGAPLSCRGTAGVEELVRLILSPTRSIPVIVISLPAGQYDAGSAFLNPALVAGACRGLAHTYVLSGPDSFTLTSLLGKEWSVFQGSIRVYWPGCDIRAQSPFDHALATYPMMHKWKGGLKGYQASLLHLIQSSSLKHASSSALLPPTLRQMREEREDVSIARVRVGPALIAKPKPIRRETDISLASLPEFAERFADRLILTPKAARAAKSSPFTDVDYVFRAVHIMGTSYWKMRTEGGSKNIQEFEIDLEDMSLRNERTGDATQVASNTEFQVDVDGRRYIMDWHLKRSGNTRDPSRCFRLYFSWCSDLSKVIIGSLPGHLTTKLS